MRGQLGLEDAEVPWPPAGSPPAPPRVQETRHTGLGAAGQGGGGAAASRGPSPPTACPPSPDDGRDMKSHERATSPCSGREPGRQAHVGPLRNSPKLALWGARALLQGLLSSGCVTGRHRNRKSRAGEVGHHGWSCRPRRQGLPDLCSATFCSLTFPLRVTSPPRPDRAVFCLFTLSVLSERTRASIFQFLFLWYKGN